MSVAQYISIAALADTYFMRNRTKLSILKAVIDNVGKNYSDKYITSFHYDSLLDKWFENFNRFDEENDSPEGIKLGDTSFANPIDFCRENKASGNLLLRKVRQIIFRYDEICEILKNPITLHELSRKLHLKKRYVKKKLQRLIEVGIVIRKKIMFKIYCQ